MHAMRKVDDDWMQHSLSEAVVAIADPLRMFQATEKLVIHPCMPCFFMRSRLELDRPFELHFFEARYRRLISRVTDGVADSYQRGGAPMGHLGRRMIYCPSNQLNKGAAAFICEVQRCQIAYDGQADVQLNPILDCVIEDAFVKEGDEDVALYSVRAREIGRGRAIDLRNAQQIEDPQSGRGASMGTADQQSLAAFVQMLINGGAINGGAG